MKYLVLLVVLLVAIGIWRKNRAPHHPPGQPRARHTPALPQDMVACAHCGVHIPRGDALEQGPLAYCSAEHQRLGRAG
jgi:uncharacterized protein